MIRDRILRNVLFPAPLRPMTPTASPRLISREMFFSAQIVEADSVPEADPLRARRQAWNGADSAAANASRRSPRFTRWPMRYCLLKASTRIATSLIRHAFVGWRKRQQESLLHMVRGEVLLVPLTSQARPVLPFGAVAQQPTHRRGE